MDAAQDQENASVHATEGVSRLPKFNLLAMGRNRSREVIFAYIRRIIMNWKQLLSAKRFGMEHYKGAKKT